MPSAPTRDFRGTGAQTPWWAALGLIIFSVGLWTLVADVPVWNVVWYVPAWYGYLLLVDAVIFWRTGRSFVGANRRELAGWAFWSVPFWLIFEAYNLRLENWSYVFALREEGVAVLVTFLAFATVLPACFLHAELVGALGLFRQTRSRPFRLPRFLESVLVVFGVFSLVAPLLWPRWAFPLVWGSPLWLSEIANRRAGAPSLLADLEAGHPGRPLRLAMGGLWAGAVWEIFNFWARCKWIYTVPGFEKWKVFEMPLPGYLGFPVLAWAAFSSYTWLERFLRGGGREAEDASRLGSYRPGRVAGSVIVALVFSVATVGAMREKTIVSYRPLLIDLNGLDAEAALACRRAGLPTPERLLAAIRRRGAPAISASTGVATERLEPAARHAALALHKGMGTHRARLLQAAGIPDVAALASCDPETLFVRLGLEAQRLGGTPPRRAEVRLWVRAARPDGVSAR